MVVNTYFSRRKVTFIWLFVFSFFLLPFVNAYGDGAKKILAYVQYTDTAEEYPNTLAAIDSYGSGYTVDELSDYTQLDSMLPGHDVLLIPEQEKAGSGTLASIGTAWAATLQTFVNNGGVVIQCASENRYHILTGSGLMDISDSQAFSGGITLVAPNDPLADGIVGSYYAEPISCWITTTDEVVVAKKFGYGDFIVNKPIGLGNVVFIGHDYYLTNDNQDRVIGNAVFNLPGIRTDLSISPSSGFESSGNEGGPFDPINGTFTLTNNSPNSLDWEVSITESWLEITPTEGTLGPNDFTSITVSTTAEANNLFLGRYFDTVTFSNLTNGVDQVSWVVLLIESSDKIYWADYGSGKIQRSNLKGTIVEDFVTGLDSPRGIAVDMYSSKVYWTDYGTDKIQRANLDGSNVEDLVTTGIGSLWGIALDPIGGKMYWTDYGTYKIQRANLDGSNIEDLVTTGLSRPYEIALDIAGGKMYWTDYGIHKIQRANLDGSNIEDMVTGLDYPSGIALDIQDSKMYWTDYGTDKIQRADLDGSNIEDLVTTNLIYNYGITLDILRGKMYWTDSWYDNIQRANMDGSNVETIISGLDSPVGIIIPKNADDLDDLFLTPQESFSCSGLEGGPFDPNSSIYTITNNGTNSLDWEVSVTESWLDVTPTGGTLNSDDSNSIAVSITADANNLLLGNHLDTVTFSNLTSGINQSRSVELVVGSIAKVYWVDYQTGKIQRSDLSGEIVEDLVTGLSSPRGIAIDISDGKIYWTDNGTDKIQRANLDGSNIEDLVTTGLYGPHGIALDVLSGKMYWTDYVTDKIQRANLDGSNIEDLVTTGLSYTYGIALDIPGGKMYWTDYGTRKIQRANLDGGNVEDLVTTGLGYTYGIALDILSGKMYWTDRGTDKIQRANLDGSNIEDLVSTNLEYPYGITLDIRRGKMYWTDTYYDRIQRANLDGSNVESFITITSLNGPAGITIPEIFYNDRPVADAGGDQGVVEGDVVCLDGSGSFDDNGDELSYNWSIVDKPLGSNAALSDSSVVDPCFVADVVGAYVVSLVVNDGIEDSEAVNVTVTAITIEDAAVGELVDVVEIISLLDTDVFKNRNMGRSLTNKINTVLELIDQGYYLDALDKLENDILCKTDGCSGIGEPDNNDWIETCEEQQQVYPFVMQAIEYLQQALQ